MPERINFTAARINNLKAPAKGRRVVYDAKVPNLLLQITHNNTRTWRFSKWIDKDIGAWSYTIGRYPGVNLNTARAKAETLAGAIAMKGAAAIEELRIEESQSVTFDDLFQKWLKKQDADEYKSLKNTVARYQNHVAPTLGGRPVAALTLDFLTRWHRGLLKRKKAQGKGKISRTTANRCLEVVGVVLNSFPDLPNPTRGVKAFREHPRTRTMDDEERGRLKAALAAPQTPPDLRDIVEIGIATGARKMLILSMQWAHLDLKRGTWAIPHQIDKVKTDWLFPLVPEVVEILKRRQLNGSLFVFPGDGKTGHITDIKRSYRQLLKRAEITNLTFHDLRTCCGSWQAEQGSSLEMIGASLGHKSPATTARHYAHIKDLEKIRASLVRGYEIWKEAENG